MPHPQPVRTTSPLRNRLHELRIVYNDKKSSFNELLVIDGSVSVHHQNLQKLAVEMFKDFRGSSPQIINELFQFRKQIPYELRQKFRFQILWVHSVFSGKESLKFLGPKVWALMPDEIKLLETKGKFRNAIKQWKLISCPSRLCKRYIDRIGFL